MEQEREERRVAIACGEMEPEEGEEEEDASDDGMVAIKKIERAFEHKIFA